MDWIGITATVIGSSGVTAIVTSILNKRKVNSDIDHTWKQGRDMDFKLSEYISKLVEEKTKERTQELRETMTENSLNYHRELKAQDANWSKKYIELEDNSNRKIQLLEMKIDVMERKFEATMKRLEEESVKLISETLSRKNCLEQLSALTIRLNAYQNKSDANKD
jgi:hypothetical protein